MHYSPPFFFFFCSSDSKESVLKARKRVEDGRKGVTCTGGRTYGGGGRGTVPCTLETRMSHCRSRIRARSLTSNELELRCLANKIAGRITCAQIDFIFVKAKRLAGGKKWNRNEKMGEGTDMSSLV